MQPGCKSDHIVILEGKQGTGKSTALRLLFEPFFSDDLSELGTKDAQMQMNGIWCLEIAELTSMRKAEQERVKAFVSRSTDRIRPPYARPLIEAKRQCVLIGTTNSDQYLKDETGARRFWPVRCGEINLDAIKQDRDQLWAEAVRLYDGGVPWWLTSNQDIAEAKGQQAERYVEDPWTDCVEAYVRDKHMVWISDILENAVHKTKEQWTQADQNRVAVILRAQEVWTRGWARLKSGPSQRVYRRQQSDEGVVS
jgi:predicted P-loop ATPase